MRYWISCIVALVLSTSCDAPEMPLPGITGKAGEFVVVMDDKLWKGSVGDTVFNGLTQHVYGLPQAEPMFNVVHVKNEAFTKIFQTHRNLLLVNIGGKYKKHIELKKNVWSSPQIVVEISAKTAEEFTQLFGKNLDRIIGHVIKKEEARILRSYNAQLNYDVVTPIKEKWNLELSIPKGYNLAREAEDFMWVRYETKDVTQSILVYSEPYQRENTFTKDGMIEVMDAFSKKYVPGPEKGTYMATFTEYPPEFTETSLSGVFATKVKGLWKVEGALMGGPFVSYAMLDEPRNRVIYLHGFVFAPGKNKRNLIRQVDAIINSAKLIP